MIYSNILEIAGSTIKPQKNIKISHGLLYQFTEQELTLITLINIPYCNVL